MCVLGARPEDYLQWATWSDEVVQGTYPTTYRNERGAGLAGAHPEFTETNFYPGRWSTRFQKMFVVCSTF